LAIADEGGKQAGLSPTENRAVNATSYYTHDERSECVALIGRLPLQLMQFIRDKQVEQAPVSSSDVIGDWVALRSSNPFVPVDQSRLTPPFRSHSTDSVNHLVNGSPQSMVGACVPQKYRAHAAVSCPSRHTNFYRIARRAFVCNWFLLLARLRSFVLRTT
jgi:hypothetical protein